MEIWLGRRAFPKSGKRHGEAILLLTKDFFVASLIVMTARVAVS
jgi:hypothetical protein